MSYILGGITLPNPKKFVRNVVETSQENLTFKGVTRKRVIGRKQQYILSYQNMTRAQVNNILSEYELNAVRSFQSTETNLALGPVDVLIDISQREYPPTGVHYLSDFELILTEVS